MNPYEKVNLALSAAHEDAPLISGAMIECASAVVAHYIANELERRAVLRAPFLDKAAYTLHFDTVLHWILSVGPSGHPLVSSASYRAWQKRVDDNLLDEPALRLIGERVTEHLHTVHTRMGYTFWKTLRVSWAMQDDVSGGSSGLVFAVLQAP